MGDKWKDHPEWWDGPPGYVWWIVTAIQLVSILVNFASAFVRV